LFLAALALATASPALAELRSPQIPVAGSSLQNYLNDPPASQTINVLTDQEHAPRWQKSASGNSAMTLMIELATNAGGNSFGLYNASAASPPPLYQVFPGAAGANWFAVASFRTAPIRLVVNLFDQNAVIQGNISYLGIDESNFGYYIENAGGIGYSQDSRNPGDQARVLAFAGTGVNEGNWWLCFEDKDPNDPDEDSDFDDAILFIESINPTAVSRSSWGALKSRFR
jgi:hypothetical protein